MRNNFKSSAYHRAKHRVERIRKFYSHLLVYLMINSGLSVWRIIRDLNRDYTFFEAIFDSNNYRHGLWFAWGIVLAIHAFSVFGVPKLLGYDWEERKIEQFMKEEKSNRMN